jgi:PhoH-like ATPase
MRTTGILASRPVNDQVQTVQKNYIIDTNVLLHDPGALLRFEEHCVIVPIQVVEEVDHFKRQVSELGRNARTVSKLLDQLRQRGRLSDGVPLDTGGFLRVLVEPPRGDALPFGLNGSVDNDILAIALDLKCREPDRPTIIVTKDTNLRIKADALGIIAQDFEAGRVAIDEVDSGTSHHTVDPGLVRDLGQHGEAALPPGVFRPNEYVHLEADGLPPLLARVDAAGGRLQRLIEPSREELGISPRNREQHFAVDALCDDRVRLVTLAGRAGTGKTLLAVAAGLGQVVGAGRYHRLLISRPIFPVGKDVGYLPGTIEDKLAPWMQPIVDNLLLLLEQQHGKEATAAVERLMRDGLVSVEPITYIRGRSIAGQYIVLDEAQNLTPLEVKTIVTRVGEGTKIVLTGDVEQIDNPYIDASSNGFVHVVTKFMDSALAAHVTLRKGERSELAELASNLL